MYCCFGLEDTEKREVVNCPGAGKCLDMATVELKTRFESLQQRLSKYIRPLWSAFLKPQ